MTCDEWLSHIASTHPQTIAMGLERMRVVGQRGGLFTFACPVITVAGTNGKGSTVAILAHLLQSTGQSVACYTSPHIVRVNERIQINGQCVSDAQLCQAFETVEALRDNILLTFF